MVMEKQKAEEKEREMQEGLDRGNDEGQDELSEAATAPLPVEHKSELDEAVGHRNEAPTEEAENMSSCENAAFLQKNVAEASEKAANNREKRESRRQRGLEHNELQNKHVLFSFKGPCLQCHEEQTSSEEAPETVPGLEKSTEQDTVPQGSNEGRKSPSEEKALSDSPVSSETKESGSIPEQPPGSEGENIDDKAVGGMKTQGNQNNQIKGSQSFTCPERPTNLALNLHHTLSAAGSLQNSAECWAEKNKSLVRKTTKDLDSPTSSQIQRYVDDPGKLKYKREKWKGKRQTDAGQNEMLSQSLDERTRADKSPQDQLE